MVVFGIDPGSVVTGFGVVQRQRGRLIHVASGCIKTHSKEPMEQRLMRIHDGLLEAIQAQHVDEVAIEAIFRYKSSESALRLGQARGVALLAAGRAGFSATPYNPMTVKKSVGAHGGAGKEGLARVVRMLLGTLPEGPTDITDALAIAITHLNHRRTAGIRR